MPASDSMFLLCRRYQRSSTELVIYSRDVKHPVSRTTRTRVTPAGIAQFLRRRRTSWECFCSAVEERATPVRFVSTMNGFTKAVCYFHNNKCGFSINPNETCHTAHHISTYEDWPVFQAAANTAALVTRFGLRQLNSPLHHSEIAPYFVLQVTSVTWPPYHFPFILACTCLRLVLLYRLSVDRILGTVPVPRLPTLAPTRRHSAVFPTARDQLLGHAHHPVQHPMQHVEPDALVVPPEDVPDLPMVQEGPILSPNEQDHLFKLAAGGGIHEFDANCLLEKCDGCRHVFIPTALRLHIIEGCGER
ncbi:hypothetical protein EV424DRAFT_1610174 [Suillus variegatus]|nr:hypothetical protein EV424DRAFT_1610174 [Suillus variegatus]